MEDAARDAYGRLRTSLERQGERIGAHDMLIAAHALTLGATLVTNNEKKLRRDHLPRSAAEISLTACLSASNIQTFV